VEWPDEQAEAAYLSEASTRDEPGTPEPATLAAQPPVDRALPDLESLVAKVPPELAALLDNLFRARFTAVRRLVPERPAAS